MSKKILFIGSHRINRSPSQRFRFEQYLDKLEQNGYKYELSELLNAEDDKIFYTKGRWIQKMFLAIRCFRKRLNDLKKAHNFDIVFIQREAFFTGTTYFERKLKKLPVKVIFDFDDSIWLPNVSQGNKKLEWLKNYDKTKTIIELSDVVIAGNQYLANYANQFNKNVSIIPTTIDTNYHIPLKNKLRTRICVGWTGSLTTVKHFEIIVPVLKELQLKYGDKIYFKLIGDEKYTNKELKLKGTKWNLKTEIEDLQEIDIGIMPLPDDEWAKGKCGFKGLQYMALEIPTIMSPVGVNTSIINDGINGYLANSNDDWINKISKLIESEELRKTIGNKGRQTIKEKYSVEYNKKKYLDIFKSI